MNALLLTGGRVIDPANHLDAQADLLICEGKIAAVGPDAAAKAPSQAQRLEVKGCVVCPGLIDMHVHLREPGQTAKETIATGAAAAARGGFTSVLCMPNTAPAIDNAGTVALIHELAAAQGAANVYVAGAITRNLAGEELAPIGSLKKAGVVAITDDGCCVQNNELMRRALEYARMFDLPVLDHCQDYSLVSDGVMNEGYWSTALGLRGWPAAGEEMMVARDILLAQTTGARVHCQHVSTAGSVQLLRAARQRGLPVSAEAAPHHFTLTDAAVAGGEKFWNADGKGIFDFDTLGGERPAWPAYDTHFKMNPPLRSAQDRAAILEALADGTIDIVASDHAPHCDYEKQVEFDYAPFGITGLETALALALMQLYHAKRLSLAGLLATFTLAPARLLGLAKGTLSVGADADVTVLDPDREWVFDKGATASKCFNSPFYGWRLKGKALATIVGGESLGTNYEEDGNCITRVLCAGPGRAEELKWMTDLPKAQAKAKEESRLVLIDFTGSDWCPWCIKLRKEVFSTPEFTDYAKKNLVPVEVDFPNHKEQAPELKEANKALKAKYKIRGYPTVIVLNSEGKKIGELGYEEGGPKPFIAKLEELKAKANKETAAL